MVPVQGPYPMMSSSSKVRLRFLSDIFFHNMRKIFRGKPKNSQNVNSQTDLILAGCDHCECDEGGALSSCQLAAPHCKPHHDLLIEATSCDARGLRCCRLTCDGPGTMCLPNDAPNTDLGPSKCKEGYKCVKAPSRLKRRFQLS